GAAAPLPAALDHRVVLEPALRDAADGGGGAVLRQALGELAALLDALRLEEPGDAAGRGRRRVLRHVHARAVVDAVAGQPVAALLPGGDLPRGRGGQVGVAVVDGVDVRVEALRLGAVPGDQAALPQHPDDLLRRHASGQIPGADVDHPAAVV